MSRREPTGDCYESAFAYFTDQTLFAPDADVVLVHGIATGQGPIAGVRFGHAWTEHGRGSDALVVDLSNGRELRMPAALYYAIGRIDSTECRRYTLADVRRHVSDTEHSGPWEPGMSPESDDD